MPEAPVYKQKCLADGQTASELVTEIEMVPEELHLTALMLQGRVHPKMKNSYFSSYLWCFYQSLIDLPSNVIEGERVVFIA